MAARLPQPGSDEGSWGDILNSFLAVEHNNDGTLKKSGDISQALSAANSAYVKPTGGIPRADLNSSVQTSLTNADASVGHTHVAANITDFAARVMDTVQAKIVAGSNVTTSYNSTTGELTITATVAGGGSGSTTVDSVAGRVGDVVIVAGDINSGVFNVARIPTGTTNSTVALGNHLHDDRYYTETEINGLYGNVSNTSDINKPVSTAQAAAIASSIVGTVRVALWNGSNYLVGSTVVTSSNRVAGTYYKFIAGPDPATLGLAINGDEWKTSA